MLSALFDTAKFTYGNINHISGFFTPKTNVKEPQDVQTTLDMIQLAINGWKDTDPMKPFVEKALRDAAFIWDTIQLKQQKHNEKYFSEWRTLDIDDEYQKLYTAISILEQRFTIASISKMNMLYSIGT